MRKNPIKVLITGITGMVGSHLADFLLDKTDWDIHGLCRWRSPQNNVDHLIPRVNSGDRVFFHYGDLRDYISLQNVVENVKPEYVFHLAAQSFPKTRYGPPKFNRSNRIRPTTPYCFNLVHNEVRLQ